MLASGIPHTHFFCRVRTWTERQLFLAITGSLKPSSLFETPHFFYLHWFFFNTSLALYFKQSQIFCSIFTSNSFSCPNVKSGFHGQGTTACCKPTKTFLRPWPHWGEAISLYQGGNRRPRQLPHGNSRDGSGQRGACHRLPSPPPQGLWALPTGAAVVQLVSFMLLPPLVPTGS